GYTQSADFTAGCTAPCTVLNGTLGGCSDAFVPKINAAGTALVYSTYLGGCPTAGGVGIAVDAAAAASVAGATQGGGFTAGCTAPCTVLNPTLNAGATPPPPPFVGPRDAFVAKIADIMSPTPGTVSLGGFIDSAGTGGKATFGGSVQFQSGDPSPTGS